MDAYDASIIESELVEPSALSYTLHNLTAGTRYHVQLLGLWDNGTLTREVRSKTLQVTTLEKLGKDFVVYSFLYCCDLHTMLLHG